MTWGEVEGHSGDDSHDRDGTVRRKMNRERKAEIWYGVKWRGVGVAASSLPMRGTTARLFNSLCVTSVVIVGSCREWAGADQDKETNNIGQRGG